MMNNYLTTGLSYLLNGFGLITKPSLRRFVVIPLLINTLLFIGLFFLSHYFVEQFNVWFAEHLPKWLQWLSTILWLLFFISFFMTIVYTFVIVANIISAPFNSFLAEKVEYYLTGHIAEGRSLYENLKDIPRIVGRQIAIIGYYIPRALLMMILFFVPIIQTIAPLLAFLFHAWFMSLIYLDYPTDNHQVPLKEVKVWMKQRRWLTLGFGMGVLISSMIPLINCLTIPAAIAGATKCWIEHKRNEDPSIF